MRIGGGRKLSYFFLSVVVSAGTNLGTIPLVIGAVGAESWASIAAGQALGSIASVILGLGWGFQVPRRLRRKGIPAPE